MDRVGRWSGEQWKEISPFLDQALDLEKSERGRWLRDLSAHRPQLADDLRALLATPDAIDAARFLEHSPLSPGAEPMAGQQFGGYILESLLGSGEFIFIGLPLKWRGGTASPIRAVAVFEM